MNTTRCLQTLLAVVAALALPAPHVLAASLSPPADLSTWACSGECGALAANGDIGLSMLASRRDGYVATSGSTVYCESLLSGTVGAEPRRSTRPTTSRHA